MSKIFGLLESRLTLLVSDSNRSPTGCSDSSFENLYYHESTFELVGREDHATSISAQLSEHLGRSWEAPPLKPIRLTLSNESMSVTSMQHDEG
jgi:hypothetical protein